MEITVNHLRLHYEVQGKGQPLILLHGNGENLHLFDTIVPALATHFQIYRLDTRGHGQSQAVNVYHYQDMMTDVYQFIQALDIEKPILYGFSDGGIIGLLLASQYPWLLSKLIISGANTQPLALNPVFRLMFHVVKQFRPDPKLDLMFREPHITPVDLQKIMVSTLVLAGAHDLIDRRETRLIAKNIPNAQLKIIPQASHSSYVAQGLLLVTLIDDFAGSN